jgi:hypothetical protein
MTNECLVRYSKPILCNISSRLSDKLAVESNPDQGVELYHEDREKNKRNYGKENHKRIEK